MFTTSEFMHYKFYTQQATMMILTKRAVIFFVSGPKYSGGHHF